MDDKRRGFAALSIAPCSHLAGKKRFPKNGDLEPPPIAQYRNNLTALSQYHNLFFLAYTDTIHVYQPQFPTQLIPSKPRLEFRLATTQHGLAGYIDPGHPHAVNHLVVGDLGEEEILLATCDDGDVVAYTTRHILNAIEVEQETELLPFEHVRPFFKRNVGMSAWGVAIHKAARLIAISSNTRQIVVFAFAIGQRSSSDGLSSAADVSIDDLDTDPGSVDWERVTTGSPDFRSRNQEIILKGHSHNIPSVAFCNTKDDPTGRYLASTDISGSTYVWDIWKGAILIKASERFKIGNSSFPGWRHGWGVACLDPSFCRLSTSKLEAFGHDVVRCDAGRFGIEADNSASLQNVPDSSRWHPAYSKYTAVPSMNESGDSEEDSDEGSDASISDDEENEEDGDTLMGNGLDSPHDNANVPLNILNEPSGTMYLFELANTPNAVAVPAQISTSHPPSHSHQNPHQHPPKLPFHLFQAFEANILLSHNLHPLSPSLTESLACKRLLAQDLPPNLSWLHQLFRINMLLQIPDLGLIVLGNQSGRVALLTTTVLRRKNEHVGFRVDWLLPLKSQEEKGQRPESPLLGMAVGPIQGREMIPAGEERDGGGSGGGEGGAGEKWRAVESSRRYRLMMVYYDHTVLSYEIWRDCGGEGVLVG